MNSKSIFTQLKLYFLSLFQTFLSKLVKCRGFCLQDGTDFIFLFVPGSTVRRLVGRLWTTPPPGRRCQPRCRSSHTESKLSSTRFRRRPSLSLSLSSHGPCSGWYFEIYWTYFFFIWLVIKMFLFHSLAMFYVIALAGAHKKVISQLREQLAMVCLLCFLRNLLIWLSVVWHVPLLCPLVPQEGNDKRFLIQKMFQAQEKLNAEAKQRGSRSPRSPCYHTSFASNFPAAMRLSHSPPASSTQVWRNFTGRQIPVRHWSWIRIFSFWFLFVWTLKLVYLCRPANISVSRLLSVLLYCWTISEQILRSVLCYSVLFFYFCRFLLRRPHFLQTI